MTIENERKEKKQDNVKITLTIPSELDTIIDMYSRKGFIKKTQWIVQSITEKVKKEMEKDEENNK